MISSRTNVTDTYRVVRDGYCVDGREVQQQVVADRYLGTISTYPIKEDACRVWCIDYHTARYHCIPWHQTSTPLALQPLLWSMPQSALSVSHIAPSLTTRTRGRSFVQMAHRQPNDGTTARTVQASTAGLDAAAKVPGSEPCLRNGLSF